MKINTYHLSEDFDEIKLNTFLNKNSSNCYFQTPNFFRVCEKTINLKPLLLILYDNDEIKASLLSFIQYQINIPFFNYLSSRSIIWGGPIVEGDNKEYLEKILSFYNKKNRNKALYTQVRNVFNIDIYKEVFLKQSFVFEEHLNIIVDLKKEEDELWKDVHSKRRNEIRRATKEGTKFIFNNSYEALLKSYNILIDVYKRAKLPLPSFSHFESLLKLSDNKSGLRIATAVYNEKIIGCMLILICNNTIYDYYAGSYKSFYNKYPNDLIPWEIFKWGKENDFSYFDFGGAGKPNIPYGVRDYKKKFGGNFVNYGRFLKIHNKAIYLLAVFAFKLIQNIKK